MQVEIYKYNDRFVMKIEKLTSEEWGNIVEPSLEKIALTVNNLRKKHKQK